MINFTSENILQFIKKFSDFGNQKDELLLARLQRDCVDLGVGVEMDELISKDKLRLFSGSKFCPNCGKTMIPEKKEEKD